jgi:hypothetical protein
MLLKNLPNRQKSGYTTWGCMWEKGQCTKDELYLLKSGHQHNLPMQTRVTAFWPDGSVKWTAHTADATLLEEEIEVLPAKTQEQQSLAKAAITQKIQMHSQKGICTIDTGIVQLSITEGSNRLFDTLCIKGKVVLKNAEPILLLEEPSILQNHPIKIEKTYYSKIKKWSIEEEGAIRLVIKYEGVHCYLETEEKLPFIIRLKVGQGSSKIDVQHTFVYDGDEEKDYLKGLGMRFLAPMKGALYNRHVKFEGDYGCFHETLAQLLSWRPRVPEEIYKAQVNGEKLDLQGQDKEIVDQVMEDMPFWSEYDFCQQSASHFAIKKKIYDANCCYLEAQSGKRSRGGAAFGSEQGSILFAMRDFWEKYPSGYTFKNLDQDEAEATVWLWSPKAEVMDFRHYANRGYNQVYYEGYDFKGATPYGIGCTNEFSIDFAKEVIPSDERLQGFSGAVGSPPQYIGDPAFYHKLRAFGYWSLPTRETEVENWIEDQLDQAFAFYKQEVEQRSWYGMFNYGDFMHTYDQERHQWRYDMGGYAWDNTELVPTLWLWLMFLRTGREDVFTVAEKMSRHTSEIDVYHIGDFKGLGSRHNVSHWGCPCKEARIAMAAHHRVYYYLTGDLRMEDIFEELKDNELTFLKKDPLETFYEKEEMVYPSHARSGPDWSSLCANWMTQWERFNDATYKKKMEVGIEDIKKAPLQLISGPDFEFDPETNHLRYIGERTTGGTHLQICMGAPQVWLEMSDLLADSQWTKMLADYGRFYYLSKEAQLEESSGIIGEREWSLPFMAAAMGAFGASYLKDKELAKTTWGILLSAMIQNRKSEGFKTSRVQEKGNQENLIEIPWISTNFAAQWCLNAMMALDFIKQELPITLEEVFTLIEAMPKERFRKA